MDEVILKGTKYISSKRAAKVTGYAKDYIGQLVRMGKLHAVKVGRSWFVDEKAVNALVSPTVGSHILGKTEMVMSQPQSTALTNPYLVAATIKFPNTWSEVKYLHDDEPLLPEVSDTRENLSLNDETGSRVFVKRIRKGYEEQHYSKSSVSIDGIKVVVRDVRTKSEPVALIGTPTEPTLKVTSASNIARVFVSALLVSLVVLLVPIFA